MSNTRKIVKIPLRGLNLKDSRHAVEMGYCARANNMALRDGVWQSVGQHSEVEYLKSAAYKIKHRHSILPSNEFIAVTATEVCHVKYSVGSFDKVKSLLTINVDNMITVVVTSSSNYLFIRYRQDGFDMCKMFKYTASTGYAALDFDSVQVPLPNIAYDYFTPTSTNTADPALRVATVKCGSADSDIHNLEKKFVSEMTKHYETIYANINKSGYIHGAVCLMVAIKLKNGVILKNGPVLMMLSEPGSMIEAKSLYRREDSADPHSYHFFKNIYGFIPKLSFATADIAALRENEYVQSLVIYSTRDTPIYNFDSVFYDFPRNPSEYTENFINGYMTSFVKSCHLFDSRNADIVNNPFYQIAEIDIRESGVSAPSLRLTYHNHYNEIEKKPIYQPNISLHTMVAYNTVSINQRLHQWDIKGATFKGYDVLSKLNNVTSGTITYVQTAGAYFSVHIYTTILIEGNEYITVSVTSMPVWESTAVGDLNDYFIRTNLMTYPDARAVKMSIYCKNRNEGYYHLGDYNLKAAPANDYAYHMDMSRDSMAHIVPVKIISCPLVNLWNMPVIKPKFEIKDKVFVSQSDLPYLFYHKNVYKIGDREGGDIVDINMPTDQLTETRFGEYPVYVFTTSGIFAMEQGEEGVLYRSVVKISNDVVATESSTVSALGAIFYFSQGGLKRLSGNTGTELYDGINSELKEYVRGAKLLYAPVYDELIVFNSKKERAYIYSLTKEVWSSRDMKGDLISYDEYIDFADSRIFRYTQPENEQSKLVSTIITRELALGEEWPARLETLKVNFARHSGVTVHCFASNDGKEWANLGACNKFGRLRRTKSSWRYFKIKITGYGLAVDDFMVEYFTRFIKHLD